MKGDHPMLVRVKYLVITELTIATLFASVCYEASEVMLSVSLFFQWVHLWPFEKP
jgi:hypothetical protein